MEKRQLGKSELYASVVGYGAWAAGKAGWGNVSDREIEQSIWRAYELGINFFDTAPVYGFGESERVLGKVLKPVRDKVIIATKAGLSWNSEGAIWNDVSREAIFREIDESLQRLGTDYIDLYQVHWPDPTGQTPIEETVGALRELAEAGKIRYIGVSNFTVEQIAAAQAVAPVVSLQSQYNLLQRQVEKQELPYVTQHQIGFIPYSPLAQGLLTGKFSGGFSISDQDVRKQLNSLFAEGQFARNVAKAEALKPFAEKYGKTPGQVAINWLLTNRAVTTVIAGAKTPEQVEENAAAYGWHLTPEDAAQIDTLFQQP
jgi:aryl-alcohol dehydrogenase-like predicted oxidoreductase